MKPTILKEYIWEWDEEKKILRLIFSPYGISESVSFEVDKNHLYSLDSYIRRIWRKLSSQRRSKRNVKISAI